MTVKLLIAHARPDMVSGAELAITDMVLPLRHRMACDMLVPGRGALLSHFEAQGLTVVDRTISGRRRMYPGWHTLQSYLAAGKIKQSAYSMILANTFGALPRVVTLSRFADLPLAVCVREYMRPIPFHRELFRKSDRILAVSRDVRDYLLSGSLCQEDQVVVCHDSIRARDVCARADAARQLRSGALRTSQEYKVGWIGRITRYKQPDLFIKAIPHVLRKIPSVRFLVIGSPGGREAGFYSEIRRLSKELGVAEQVEFLGQRGDVIELLTSMDVYCMTSDREPFPRIVLESQLTGCPVIASNSGGCPEMVEDGETGVLFDVHSPKAEFPLADAIVRVLRDHAFSRRLARTAFARKLSEFSEDSDGLTAQVRHFERVITHSCGARDIDTTSRIHAMAPRA